MQKETNDENYRVCFPKLHMKTPLIEQTIRIKDKVYLVNTRIDICVYKKAKDGS